MKTWVGVALLASALVITAQPASASTNTAPSTAVEIAPGLPFSGSWPDTPRRESCCDYWHFYRPTFTLRTGDTVQLAVDNYPGSGVSLCLIGPTDDFGATDVLGRECERAVYDDNTVGQGQKSRTLLVYERAQPGGFLIATTYIPDDVTITGGYSMTVERVIARVNIGMVPPAALTRRFVVRAALRYGDNTLVADGVSSTLQARWQQRSKYGKWRIVSTAPSAGGTVILKGRLPGGARGSKAQIRACAEQPGGTVPRCTRAYPVRVR